MGELLDISGIGKDRVCLKWVSASEGQLFADYVAAFTKQTCLLGPFNPEQYKLELDAVERALMSPRLRWLTGMEMALTEKGNVYGEKLDEDDYQELIRKSVEEEYEEALILEVLKVGPQSVREIAFETGFPVYTVSLRLGNLERHNKAQFQEYDGTTPKFVSLAA